MEYKFHKNGSYNIHTIKTDRFKNVRMEIVFRNNYEKSEVALRKVLFSILTQVSAEFKTRRDLMIKREDMYDTYIYPISNRVGGVCVNKICVDFLNPKYVKEPEFLESVIKLPFDMIFNPYLEDGEFAESCIEEQKTILRSGINNIQYNPSKYAIREALKSASKNANFSSFITLDDVANINQSNIRAMYENVLTHDYVDIFVIGDIDCDEVIDLINTYAKFTTIKTHELYAGDTLRPRSSIKKARGKKDFLQTQLVYVLSVDDLDFDDAAYAANLYDTILGGSGLDSKLSKALREDNSLVYGVSSYYQKHDGLIIIHTSLDKKDVRLAKKLIESTLNNMRKGRIEDSELEDAKTSITSSINIRQDDPEYIIEDYLMQYIKTLEPIVMRLDKYKSVSVSDIKRIASHIKINTIYELENGEL